MSKYPLLGLCFLLSLAAPPLDGGETNLTRFQFTEPHMGTTFQVILYAPDRPSASRGARAAFKRIAELDGIMSDYRPASELMQLCQKAGGEAVKVSNDLFYVLSTAQQVADSRGYYNPQWHYDNEPETRAALDLISSDYFSRYEPGVFAPLTNALLTDGDHYMHLSDLKYYLESEQRLT